MDPKKMIAIIQVYIFHKKNVEVQISPNLPRDLSKLLRAYSIAKNWYDNNIQEALILN